MELMEAAGVDLEQAVTVTAAECFWLVGELVDQVLQQGDNKLPLPCLFRL